MRKLLITIGLALAATALAATPAAAQEVNPANIPHGDTNPNHWAELSADFGVVSANSTDFEKSIVMHDDNEQVLFSRMWACDTLSLDYEFGPSSWDNGVWMGYTIVGEDGQSGQEDCTPYADWGAPEGHMCAYDPTGSIGYEGQEIWIRDGRSAPQDNSNLVMPVAPFGQVTGDWSGGVLHADTITFDDVVEGESVSPSPAFTMEVEQSATIELAAPVAMYAAVPGACFFPELQS